MARPPTPYPRHSEGALWTFTERSSLGKDTVVLLLVPLQDSAPHQSSAHGFCRVHPIQKGAWCPAGAPTPLGEETYHDGIFRRKKSHDLEKKDIFPDLFIYLYEIMER